MQMDMRMQMQTFMHMLPDSEHISKVPGSQVQAAARLVAMQQMARRAAQQQYPQPHRA